MRKVAAHRIFLAPWSEWRSMHVVELDASGSVVALTPLTEEQRATEWLGGVIVVTSKYPERYEEENFSAFCSRLYREDSVSQLAACRAYHLASFDVAGMHFTPASRVIRL